MCNNFNFVFLGDDAEETKTQNQATEHGADGQSPVGLGHRINRRGGIRRGVLLVVRRSRGGMHSGAPDQSCRHVRFADSRYRRLKKSVKFKFDQSKVGQHERSTKMKLM
jgi:hypothetical protein